MGSSPNLWLTVSQLDSSSHSATTATREKPEQQQDPAQPKISEEIKLYIYIYNFMAKKKLLLYMKNKAEEKEVLYKSLFVTF